MSRFKSSKSIINWLNQRKMIMFSRYGFTFFYKMIKGRLHCYDRTCSEWKPCDYYNIHEFFLTMDNWYKTKHSEVH
jgi:hypothetical protein